MLRRIVGIPRAPEEPWIDWIRRATRKACREAHSIGIRFWLQTHIRNKFLWAGHVARMNDMRLAKRATEWRDNEWWRMEVEIFAHLRIKRPKKTRWFRWEDDLRRFADQKARRDDVAGKQKHKRKSYGFRMQMNL